jgi:hypothetical protein
MCVKSSAKSVKICEEKADYLQQMDILSTL